MVRRLLLILIGVVIISSGASAQEPEQILVWIDGDFAWYSLSQRSITPITISGQNDFPVISPDGTLIAYRIIPQDAADLLQDDEALPVQLPNDIALMNLDSLQSETITRQPSVGNQFIIRSRPVWSPDGRFLVWAEVRLPEEVYMLMIRDTATETIEEISLTLAPRNNFAAPPAVINGETGIAVEGFEFDEENVTHIQYTVYDYDGSLQATLIPREQPTDEGDFPRAAIWIQDGERELFGVIFDSAVWHLMTADEQREYVGNIEFVSESGQVLSIFFTEVDGRMRFVVEMPLNPDAEMVSLDNVTVDQNGEWFAYIIRRPDRAVWVGPNGNSIIMGDFDAVVGSYPRWRLP